eukprot:gene19119-21036_t
MPLTERQQMALLLEMTAKEFKEGSVRRRETNDEVESSKKSSGGSSSKGDSSKITKRNKNGETKLHLASIKGDIATVQNWIKRGFDVNVTDYAGWTPLHEACSRGHYNIVKVLLRAGADANAKGLEDDTPLHDACSNDNVKVVQILLKYGADPKMRNEDLETPLDSCASDEISDILEEYMSCTEDGREKFDFSSWSLSESSSDEDSEVTKELGEDGSSMDDECLAVIRDEICKEKLLTKSKLQSEVKSESVGGDKPKPSDEFSKEKTPLESKKQFKSVSSERPRVSKEKQASELKKSANVKAKKDIKTTEKHKISREKQLIESEKKTGLDKHHKYDDQSEKPKAVKERSLQGSDKIATPSKEGKVSKKSKHLKEKLESESVILSSPSKESKSKEKCVSGLTAAHKERTFSQEGDPGEEKSDLDKSKPQKLESKKFKDSSSEGKSQSSPETLRKTKKLLTSGFVKKRLEDGEVNKTSPVKAEMKRSEPVEVAVEGNVRDSNENLILKGKKMSKQGRDGDLKAEKVSGKDERKQHTLHANEDVNKLKQERRRKKKLSNMLLFEEEDVDMESSGSIGKNDKDKYKEKEKEVKAAIKKEVMDEKQKKKSSPKVEVLKQEDAAGAKQTSSGNISKPTKIVSRKFSHELLESPFFMKEEIKASKNILARKINLGTKKVQGDGERKIKLLKNPAMTSSASISRGKDKSKDLDKKKGKGKDWDKNREKHKGKDRDRDKGKVKDKDWDIGKDKERERDRYQEKDLGNDKERDKDKKKNIDKDWDVGKDKDKDRYQEKGVGSDKERDKDKDKKKYIDKDWGMGKNNDNEKVRYQEKDLGSERERDKDKEKEKGRDKEEETDKNRDSEKEIQHHKRKSNEVDFDSIRKKKVKTVEHDNIFTALQETIAAKKDSLVAAVSASEPMEQRQQNQMANAAAEKATEQRDDCLITAEPTKAERIGSPDINLRLIDLVTLKETKNNSEKQSSFMKNEEKSESSLTMKDVTAQPSDYVVNDNPYISDISDADDSIDNDDADKSSSADVQQQRMTNDMFRVNIFSQALSQGAENVVSIADRSRLQAMSLPDLASIGVVNADVKPGHPLFSSVSKPLSSVYSSVSKPTSPVYSSMSKPTSPVYSSVSQPLSPIAALRSKPSSPRISGSRSTSPVLSSTTLAESSMYSPVSKPVSPSTASHHELRCKPPSPLSQDVSWSTSPVSQSAIAATSPVHSSFGKPASPAVTFGSPNARTPLLDSSAACPVLFDGATMNKPIEVLTSTVQPKSMPANLKQNSAEYISEEQKKSSLLVSCDILRKKAAECANSDLLSSGVVVKQEEIEVNEELVGNIQLQSRLPALGSGRHVSGIASFATSMPDSTTDVRVIDSTDSVCDDARQKASDVSNKPDSIVLGKTITDNSVASDAVKSAVSAVSKEDTVITSFGSSLIQPQSGEDRRQGKATSISGQLIKEEGQSSDKCIMNIEGITSMPSAPTKENLASDERDLCEKRELDICNSGGSEQSNHHTALPVALEPGLKEASLCDAEHHGMTDDARIECSVEDEQRNKDIATAGIIEKNAMIPTVVVNKDELVTDADYDDANFVAKPADVSYDASDGDDSLKVADNVTSMDVNYDGVNQDIAVVPAAQSSLASRDVCIDTVKRERTTTAEMGIDSTTEGRITNLSAVVNDDTSGVFSRELIQEQCKVSLTDREGLQQPGENVTTLLNEDISMQATTFEYKKEDQAEKEDTSGEEIDKRAGEVNLLATNDDLLLGPFHGTKFEETDVDLKELSHPEDTLKMLTQHMRTSKMHDENADFIGDGKEHAAVTDLSDEHHTTDIQRLKRTYLTELSEEDKHIVNMTMEIAADDMSQPHPSQPVDNSSVITANQVEPLIAGKSGVIDVLSASNTDLGDDLSSVKHGIIDADLKMDAVVSSESYQAEDRDSEQGMSGKNEQAGASYNADRPVTLTNEDPNIVSLADDLTQTRDTGAEQIESSVNRKDEQLTARPVRAVNIEPRGIPPVVADIDLHPITPSVEDGGIESGQTGLNADAPCSDAANKQQQASTTDAASNIEHAKTSNDNEDISPPNLPDESSQKSKYLEKGDRNSRRQASPRLHSSWREMLFRNHVTLQPKIPTNYDAFSMFTGKYHLANDDKYTEESLEEDDVEDDLKELQMEQTVELEKLHLAMEQELLRVESKVQLACSNRKPISACSAVMYETLQQYAKLGVNCSSSLDNETLDIDKLRRGWIQDVLDKYVKLEERMKSRHETEVNCLEQQVAFNKLHTFGRKEVLRSKYLASR